MTKNEFKVGDRVAIKSEYVMNIGGCINRIPAGENGVVIGVYDNELYVNISKYHIYVLIPIPQVKLVQPLDRRTAFLTRLQSLLREFDVFLVAHKTDMPVSVYFNDVEEDMPFASIGEEVNKGCGVVITADNIMDFEKE